MSPILSSQGVVLATAMAAVSGTVILLAFRLQKSLPGATQLSLDQIPQASQQVLRSCISPEGRRRDQKKKQKKKRVHFADDVVDPRGDGEEFRRQQSSRLISSHSSSSSSSSSTAKFKKKSSINNGVNVAKDRNYREMPANRVALYNGILRDRVVHQRLAYSH